MNKNPHLQYHKVGQLPIGSLKDIIHFNRFGLHQFSISNSLPCLWQQQAQHDPTMTMCTCTLCLSKEISQNSALEHYQAIQRSDLIIIITLKVRNSEQNPCILFWKISSPTDNNQSVLSFKKIHFTPIMKIHPRYISRIQDQYVSAMYANSFHILSNPCNFRLQGTNSFLWTPHCFFNSWLGTLQSCLDCWQ